MELTLPQGDMQDVRFFATSCKIFCYILKKYAEAKKIARIQDFEADKLFRLFYKISSKLKKEMKLVLPVIDMGAKHGTRIAFPYGPEENPLFVLEGIQLLNKEGRAKSQIIEVTHEKWKYGTLHYISPLIAETEMGILLKRNKISENDLSIIKNFVEVTASLTSEEIESLGRHENPEQTRESIKIEIEAWIKHFKNLIQQILENDFVNNTKKIKRADNMAWEIWSDAQEMKKKAQWESSIYKDGFEKIKYFSDKFPGIVNVFSQVQRSDEEIWENERVSSLAFPSFLCFEYSSYLRGILQNCAFLPRNGRIEPEITKKKTEESFLNLAVLLTIDPTMKPTKFSEDIIEKLKQNTAIAPRVEVNNPNDVWGKNIDFIHFSECIKKIFHDICDNYLNETKITLPIRRTGRQLGLPL